MGDEPQDVGARRPARGVLVGLAMLLVVALPATWAGFLALISFSGCLIDCSEPDPARGALWSVLAAALLALPVAGGLLAARVPLRRATPWLVGLAGVVAVGAVLAQRVV